MLHYFLLERRIDDHFIELIFLLRRYPIILSSLLLIFALIVTPKSVDLFLFLLLVLLPPELYGSFLLLFYSFLFIHEPFGFYRVLVEGVAVLYRRVKHGTAASRILRFIDLS